MYPPKPQPNQQQQDPLLDGLISQPQQPQQPAQGGQTGGWGGGNNWWGGASGMSGQAAPQAATTGYGTYSPNPNVPGTPAPPATPGGDGGGMPPAEDLPDNVHYRDPNATVPGQGQDVARNNRISGLQRQIQQFQQQAAQYPSGTPYGDKIRGYLQQLMIQLQQAMNGQG